MSLMSTAANRLKSLVSQRARGLGDDAAKLAGKSADDVAKALRLTSDDAAKAVSRRYADDTLKISNAARQAAAGDDLSRLTFKRAAEQGGLDGGHLPKQIMEDQLGRKWMFKTVPAGEEFRALGDKVGADLLEAVGVRTPKVQLTSQELGGKMRFGTIQKLVETNGQKLSDDVTKLTKDQIDDLMESHVGRWLISDHDGKAANFLVGQDGRLVTIDLGQMYKFFPGDSLDRLYAPNHKKPVFTALWDGYVKGKVDLNFDKGLQQVAKVEALPDEKFIQILRPYAEARYKQNVPVPGYRSAEEFLGAALKRKQGIRRDMLGFYDGLAKERGLSGLEEALGKLAPQHADAIKKVGLKPVQPLHPRIRAQYAQSKANAARYKEDTIQALTEQLGSRVKAEAKYEALYKDVRKKMFVAANYPDSSLRKAISEGRIRSMYDLPLKQQVELKGPAYVAKRNTTDAILGIRKENPMYVTVGGNKKYQKDIAKYGNVMMQYDEAEMARRTLFSDGNHNYHAISKEALKSLNPREAFRKVQFTWFDTPHLVVNRLVKEGLDPKAPSHLIEGMVFGGLNPAKHGQAMKVLRPGAETEALVELAKKAGLAVSR